MTCLQVSCTAVLPEVKQFIFLTSGVSASFAAFLSNIWLRGLGKSKPKSISWQIQAKADYMVIFNKLIRNYVDLPVTYDDV